MVCSNLTMNFYLLDLIILPLYDEKKILLLLSKVVLYARMDLMNHEVGSLPP